MALVNKNSGSDRSDFVLLSPYHAYALSVRYFLAMLIPQKMIADNGSILKTYTIDSGHSLYFAKPDELTSILKQLN